MHTQPRFMSNDLSGRIVSSPCLPAKQPRPLTSHEIMDSWPGSPAARDTALCTTWGRTRMENGIADAATSRSVIKSHDSRDSASSLPAGWGGGCPKSGPSW
eukprot:360672-Chlamydomonas_euryale.AAC.9